MTKNKKTISSYLDNAKSMIRNFIRTNQMVWSEKKWFLIGMFFVFIFISALPYLQSGADALLINYLVDLTKTGEISKYIYLLITLVVISYVAAPMAYSAQTNLLQIFWFYLDKKFQIKIAKKMSELDIAIHENPNYKDLINKVSEGGNYRIQNFIERQYFLSQSIFSVIVSTGILIYSEWWIFALIVLGTIPEIINEFRYGIRVWEIWGANAELKRRYWDINWRFHQVNSLIEMKLFNNVDFFVSLYEKLFSTFQDKEITNTKKRFRMELFAIIISQITFAVALVFYILKVIHGDIEIGTMTFVIASIGSFRSAISNLFVGFARHYQDNLFVEDIFKLIDIKEIIVKPDPGVKIYTKKAPQIVFENLSFKYPDTNKYILKNINLTIESGEKIAFVGINGAGKTTLIKLLCRFYDPTNGKILINGIDLREINLKNYYHLIGALFQDYERYHFVVKELIALGRTGIKKSLQKIKLAAKSSEADVFIEEWEKGYNQMVGKEFTGGIEPSIGQWQKLGLARTFYRDPKILILDEPTSSIDAEAESKIFEKLHNLPKDRTVILISHRFSTVRHADKICVIEHGKLLEYGTHEELIKNKKTYFKLFNLQAKGYK